MELLELLLHLHVFCNDHSFTEYVGNLISIIKPSLNNLVPQSVNYTKSRVFLSMMVLIGLIIFLYVKKTKAKRDSIILIESKFSTVNHSSTCIIHLFFLIYFTVSKSKVMQWIYICSKYKRTTEENCNCYNIFTVSRNSSSYCRYFH